MALYDHRVFKVGDSWWVAQVHSASGGAGFLPSPPIRSEWVIFTNIANDDENSRIHRIRPGFLNRLSYSAIRQLLQQAKALDSRFEMHPYNAPSASALEHPHRFTDNEGLEWVVQPTTLVRQTEAGPKILPAVEVICLQDSALRKKILLQDETTYVDAKLTSAMNIDEGLISVVKSTYEELGPFEAEAEDHSR